MPLSIVIVYFKAVITIEHVSLVNQKPYKMLQHIVVYCYIAGSKSLVECEALVGERRLANKTHYACHDTPPFVSTHAFIFLFPTNERASVHAMIPTDPSRRESILQGRHIPFDGLPLIVKDKAYQIVARRVPVGIERPRFINKYTYVGLIHRTAPVYLERIDGEDFSSPPAETSPPAGDSSLTAFIRR